jgi:hypothetical protein
VLEFSPPFLEILTNSFVVQTPTCSISGEEQSLVEVDRQQGIQEEIHQTQVVVLLYQSLELQGSLQEIRVAVLQYRQQVPKNISKYSKYIQSINIPPIQQELPVQLVVQFLRLQPVK